MNSGTEEISGVELTFLMSNPRSMNSSGMLRYDGDDPGSKDTARKNAEVRRPSSDLTGACSKSFMCVPRWRWWRLRIRRLTSRRFPGAQRIWIVRLKQLRCAGTDPDIEAEAG